MLCLVQRLKGQRPVFAFVSFVTFGSFVFQHSVATRARSSVTAGARAPGAQDSPLRPAPTMSKVKIGIVGSRFQADCIAASVRAMPEEAAVIAVASPTSGNADAFAQRHGIPKSYSDRKSTRLNSSHSQ